MLYARTLVAGTTQFMAFDDIICVVCLFIRGILLSLLINIGISWKRRYNDVNNLNKGSALKKKLAIGAIVRGRDVNGQSDLYDAQSVRQYLSGSEDQPIQSGRQMPSSEREWLGSLTCPVFQYGTSNGADDKIRDD